MNTYNLNTVSMQNKPITDMENIQWEEAIHTDNGLWIAIDDKGYSYKFDENGTLINKKRIYSKRRNWSILRPTHGKNHGMTVLISRNYEKGTLLAFQEDGQANWEVIEPSYMDDEQHAWFERQNYTH